MEQTSVQKLARVLRVMVLAVFVCNIIVLFFVPALAAMLAENRWDGQTMEPCPDGAAGSPQARPGRSGWPLSWTTDRKSVV